MIVFVFKKTFSKNLPLPGYSRSRLEISKVSVSSKNSGISGKLKGFQENSRNSRKAPAFSRKKLMKFSKKL